MAEWWDARNTRWEMLFDKAVVLASQRRLSDTLSMLKRIRSWQHRQSRHSTQNHDWHDAELLWLQGVVLERAGQTAKASEVWQRLGRLFEVIARRGESSFLPQCARCAERLLGFAPSWFSVATQLRDVAGGVPAIADAFREHALSMEDNGSQTVRRSNDGGPKTPVVEGADSRRAEPLVEGAKQLGNPDSPMSKAKLKAKRELIRKTYRELDHPATVIELCEQYLKLDSLDGVVWAWYGHSLIELGRYADAAAALQTARRRKVAFASENRALEFELNPSAGTSGISSIGSMGRCNAVNRASRRARPSPTTRQPQPIISGCFGGTVVV
jgi:tetratricopeptide (TPR) repeat protein